MVPIPLSWYGIAGAVIIAGAAVGYATLENAWRQTAQLEAAQEKAANVQNRKTIDLLRKSNEIYEEIAADLRTKIDEISVKEDEEDAAVTDLGNSDESVKKFLDTPVPAKLRCLWGERSQCGSENGGAHLN